MNFLEELFNSLEVNKEKIAFVIEHNEYSYSDLRILVGEISARLFANDENKQEVIGIVVHDDIYTYAAILSCWFCNKVYVPLNPKFPAERNANIIGQSGIRTIVSSSRDTKNITGTSEAITVLYVDGITSANQKNIHYNFERDSTDLSYILFTSGSTGIPKGVPISFENLEAFVKAFQTLNIYNSSEDRCLQMFDLSFDVSIASFLIPLLYGSSTYTVSNSGLKYMEVYKLIKRYNLTHANMVPSILSLLKPYFHEISIPSLKYCILTAEASKEWLVQGFYKCIPNAQIINLYGPTEVTIWCTAYYCNMNGLKSYNELLSIGREFPGIVAEILNEEGGVCSVNVKGELCIHGKQVTDGYVNPTERTSAAFFKKGERMFYRTGDYCFRDDEGNIYYCGRLDHQVKIQGFRVELSEIEIAARKKLDVNAVAIPYEINGIQNQIALFVESTQVNENELKDYLLNKLPGYMVPSKCIGIPEFPVNSSGKIDRIEMKKLI